MQHEFKVGDKVRCHATGLALQFLDNTVIYEVNGIDVLDGKQIIMINNPLGVDWWYAWRFSPAVPEFDPIAMGM